MRKQKQELRNEKSDIYKILMKRFPINTSKIPLKYNLESFVCKLPLNIRG